MKVLFQSRIYSDFEKIPSVRAEWGEDIVKHFFESKGFFTFRTKDIDKVNLDSNVKDLIDALFKNKNFYSTDVISFFETKEQKEQRMKDEIFVREIIKQGKPYDLGKFTKGRYHLDILFNTSGGERKREIHLLPHIVFVEVKTFLKTSKPPVISPAELYRLLYWRDKMGSGAIFLAIIEIDIIEKKAILNFVFPEKFHNIDEKWHKIEKTGFATVTNQSKFARIKLPVVVKKNEKPHTHILSFKIKGEEIKFEAHSLSYEVNIETVEAR